MTIVRLASLRMQQRWLFFFLAAVLLALPWQKRLKGVLNSFSSSWIPTGLELPAYFSKSVYLYVSDFFVWILVGFVLVRIRPSLRTFFFAGPSRCLSLLFCSALISILLSSTALYPLQYMRLIHLSFYFLLFDALISVRFRWDLSSACSVFAYSLLAVGLFEGGGAFIQYFSQSPLHLKWLGELDPCLFPFHSAHAPLRLGGEPSGDMICRASGTFSHPNILGCVLFCSLLSSLYLMVKKEKRWECLLLLLSVLFLSGALCLSFSRAAALAALLSLVALGFCLVRFRVISLKKVLWGASGIILILTGWLTFFFPPLFSRGGFFNYNALVEGADSERILYGKWALKMLGQHPLFGVGFNQYQISSFDLQKEAAGPILHSKVHNIFLLVASELGLIGLGFFLLFLYGVIRPSFKSSGGASLSLERAFFLSGFLGLLGMGMCDFFLLESVAGRTLFFTMAAFLYSVGSKRRKER